MSLELWLSNLWFYSLQTGILILVGGFLPGSFVSGARPLVLLLASTHGRGVFSGVPTPSAGSLCLIRYPFHRLGELVLTTAQSTAFEGSPAAKLYPWLGGLLVTGILLRLIWLGIGSFRIYRLKSRSTSQPLAPASSGA